MSAIQRFLKKIHNLEKRSKSLSEHSVLVGWANDAKEPAEGGEPGTSLAQIAKTLNYGRAGGKSKKDGHEYGAIPARNFVDVFKRKHLKPVTRTIVSEVLDFEEGKETVNLQKIGVVAKGQFQRAMKNSNEYEANAPFTVSGGWMANPISGKPFYAKGKKSARPLIDKGTLINSVDFEIK
ncbi:MAG: hypothetical protein IKS96_07180 [Fibrobacter sp.]|nr:hypothetical protein [Fibrobacter sp.]MBR6449710.1 hypothetical protein [Fibrobacter sp.]